MVRQGTYRVVYDCDGDDELEKAFEFMNLAILQAYMSVNVNTAFNVGSVIVIDDVVSSTGYSRELEGNKHSTECALEKLDNIRMARGAVLYTTLEPCSYRLSGKKSCAQRIIECGFQKVFFGVKEPDTFSRCEGVSVLVSAGIDVVCMKMLEEACLEPNRSLLNRDYL
ncbi:hypothetical protein BB559_001856 [Furculomyces boomerangus]|uniref:CMP/dCMP-type deaminase domain-containing protein n=2 Tax=Harpellales TaxID=61421 RepID=A0A2T9YZX9_9FUNG|nr:hypothetical protein BB559_001856 [Furculomyces boomerangus]PWA03492.1 hypothetical protein BB558_000353 [Smittium angustum]